MPVSISLTVLALVHIFFSVSLSKKIINPVKTPILRNIFAVHTRPFATLPLEAGKPARIISIATKPRSRDLYVLTASIIYVIRPNQKPTIFLDVGKTIRTVTPRRLNFENGIHGGLRSLAFHPRERKIYISAMENRPSKEDISKFHYISDVSNPITADSVLLEFKLSKSGKPIPKSYRCVFRVGMPVFDHPIKQIAFYDKFLYIAHGDGSVQSAIAGGGQGNDALGKILRIDPKPSKKLPYRIPSSNPYVKKRDMLDEVYAIGFRNPHTICFSTSGTLFVADSGRANVEEINIVKPGKNYGWSLREGTFQHVGGGLGTGVRPLPKDDAKLGFEYPVAQVGHEGKKGAGFIGQAVAGGCPIENESPMKGKYFYVDFPLSGKLFYSEVQEMKKAITNGKPKKLTQARTVQATIFHDHDNDPKTPPLKFDTLGDIMRSEPGFQDTPRVDARLGRGPNGELYWTSKSNGRIYIFTSSLPDGPGGPLQKEKSGTTDKSKGKSKRSRKSSKPNKKLSAKVMKRKERKNAKS